MALIFCDGFDHYASADITKKWTSIGSSLNEFSIQSTVKRTGTGALKIANGGSGGDRFLIKSFSNNYKTLVLGFALRVDKMNSSYYLPIQFCDASTVNVLLKLTPSLTFEVYRGTTLIGTSPVVCYLGELFYLEIKVVVDNTTGSVIIRKNETVIYELTNVDTQNGTNAYSNNFGLGEREYLTGNSLCYFDDLYVDDTDFIGDIKIETLYPSGAGANSQWTPLSGANYENVDEASQDGDTSYVTTDVVDEIDTYVFNDMVTNGTIFGVQVNMMARKDDAGYRSIAPVIRSGGVDRVGNTKSVGDTYVDYTQMYQTNPEDSLAWEKTDIDNAEFGVKCIE